MKQLNTAATPLCRLQQAIRIALLPGLCAVYGAGAMAAALPNGTVLVFDDASGNTTNTPPAGGGSYFTMSVSVDNVIYTGLTKGTDGGLVIGSSQPLGAGVFSHGGLPYDIVYPSVGYTSDHGPIDVGWGFFGNTGLHFTDNNPVDKPIVVTNPAVGSNPAVQELDFSGWRVSWNGIPEINMGGGLQFVASGGTKPDKTYNNGTGLATITCTPSCTNGASFVLDYSATVPQNDPSNFGGTPYALHLVGSLDVPTNTPPTADDVSLTTDQDTPASWTPVAADSDGPSAVTCEVVDQPTSGGSASVNGSDSCGAAGSYTPGSGFTGVDTFTYRSFDGADYSPNATVTVTVSATPPPVAVNDVMPTATGTTPVSMNVTTNDTDGDGNLDPSSITLVTPPANGSVQTNVPSAGHFTYTANAGFSGTNTFTYNVKDLDVQTSNNATVTVTVNASALSSNAGSMSGSNGLPVGGGVTTDDALSQQCVGGCWNFTISGLAGADATVVVPLSAAIPAGAVVRKLINGTWKDFTSGSGNTLASAPALSTGPTVCPPPASTSYLTGLTAGHQCVRMLIVNGGANDADLVDDDTIQDPAGIGVKIAAVDNRSSGSSGCSVTTTGSGPLQRGDWWLVTAFLGWLGAMVFRNKRKA